ncbi:MAG: PIN domain-containing protein [Alkalispirochaeta sp.]
MNVLFDTSVLVPAVVDQLANHAACFHLFAERTTAPERGFCSTHALAECYSVLTALPLRRRVTPDEARRLIDETFVARLTVVSLKTPAYTEAIARVAGQGLVSGVVYDALHVVAAEQAQCSRIYTYNTDHFLPLVSNGLQVTSP